jgi:hypothetical protein
VGFVGGEDAWVGKDNVDTKVFYNRVALIKNKVAIENVVEICVDVVFHRRAKTKNAP